MTAEQQWQRAQMRRALPLLCVILLLAWGLAWRVFGVSELGQDGFLSVDLGFSPLSQMLAYTSLDVHPPLYYALLHVWFPLAGIQYATTKFVTIACAVLALVTIERIGRRLGNWQTGLAAALLLALSPAFLQLSATTRDFVPGLFVSLFTLLLTLRFVDVGGGLHGRWFDGLLLGLATVAALLMWYLHIFFLLLEVVVFVSAYAQARRRHGGGTKGTLLGPAALVVGVALALPWYAYALPKLLAKMADGTTGYDAAPRLPSPADLATIPKTVVGGSASVVTLLATAGWLLAVLIGLVCCWRRSESHRSGASDMRRPLSTPGIQVIVPIGLALGSMEVAFVLLRWQRLESLGRYIVALLPFVVLLQGIALTDARRSLRFAAAAGVAGVLAVQLAWYGVQSSSAPIEWTRDQPLQYVAAHVQAGDALVFSDHARRAQYMLLANWQASDVNGQSSALPGTNGGCGNGPALVNCAVIMTSDATESYLHSTPQEAAHIIGSLLQTSSRLWYAESGEASNTPPVGRQALVSLAYLAWQQQIAGTDLQLYLAAAPNARRQPGVVLGGLVAIDAARFTSRAAPGGAVAVQIDWRDVRPLGGDYTVFVHLDSASGQLAAQQDGPPATGLRPTRQWTPGEVVYDRHGVLLPSDLPPGDYRLNVGLYQGQQRLNLPDGSNQVQLGIVHVRSGGQCCLSLLPPDTD